MTSALRACVSLLLACSLLVGCSAPRQPAQEAFDDLVKAVEDSDVETIDGMLAPDFYGELNRQQAMELVKRWVGSPTRIRVSVHEQGVSGDDASATLRTRLTVSAGGGIIPERSAKMMVETQWERRPDGRWHVVVGQWRQLQ